MLVSRRSLISAIRISRIYTIRRLRRYARSPLTSPQSHVLNVCPRNVSMCVTLPSIEFFEASVSSFAITLVVMLGNRASSSSVKL
nr:hypothetical protein Iba_chr03aCG6300 [Ipomoea batatas]